MRVYRGRMLERVAETPNYYSWLGRGALALGMGALSVVGLGLKSQPEIYRTGYHGEWRPHVVETHENAWAIVRRQNPEGDIRFWLYDVMQKYPRNPPLVGELQPEDTLWIPADMTLDQRNSKNKENARK